jgi:hypothetical protein
MVSNCASQTAADPADDPHTEGYSGRPVEVQANYR